MYLFIPPPTFLPPLGELTSIRSRVRPLDVNNAMQLYLFIDYIYNTTALVLYCEQCTYVAVTIDTLCCHFCYSTLPW